MIAVLIGAAAITLALKGAGATFLHDRLIPGRPRQAIDATIVAMVGVLVVTLGLTTEGQFTADARLPGMVAAGVAVWRRAPPLVVVGVAVVVTAIARAPW